MSDPRTPFLRGGNMRLIPSFGKRGRRLTVVLLIAIVAIGIFAISNALAVHNDDFQLDGNTAATCPAGNLVCSSSQKDWDDIFAVTNPTATTEAVTPTSVVSSSGPFTNATFTRDFQSGANPGACSLTNTSTKFCT